MPTYDYVCKQCGPFEAMRSIAVRDHALTCPRCSNVAERVLVSAPRLTVLTSERRHAMSTNEKSSHEPASSKSYAPKVHPSGCSCCSGKKSKATAVAPNGNKSFPGKRPWMISH